MRPRRQPPIRPFSAIRRSASPRSCWFASLSLCSAFAGAIVGAAAMFLGMTFFNPPKVEIREIVREVRVKAEPASDVKALPPETELRGIRFGESIFRATESEEKLEDRLALSGGPYGDLDSLLAERQAACPANGPLRVE